MKEAERFLSQGKIRPAIGEYKQIVENDPKDFSTLNILGDLYAKNSEKKEAAGCFTKVAEHYHAQGFLHKAIAVYNKILRVEPHSITVSEKLAQLYFQKGSVVEARAHYNSLAEQYERSGQKTEALETWKKIAELDPNNTEIYLKIGESCSLENQKDEAAAAFTEAGLRLSNLGEYEKALNAFSKALELKKNDLRALNGLVKAQINFGSSEEAAQTLENILVEQPYNRDILYLLVDCYLDMQKPADAERAVIKLVEQEPANYLKFLDLVETYLKNHDLDSAARVLSISSEHLLVGGQSDEFLHWTNEILARNPEQLDALRLLVRYYGWQRDESELKQALHRLAEAARLNDAPEDERLALTQLVMITPHEAAYAQRLHEVNTANGFEAVEFQNENVPAKIAATEKVLAFESGNGSNGHLVETNGNLGEFAFADKNDFTTFQTEHSNGDGFSENAFDGVKDFNFAYDNSETNAADPSAPENEFQFAAPDAEENSGDGLKLADELKLQKELESITFYIAQNYHDLAAKSLDALEVEFGTRTEIENLRRQIGNSQDDFESENKTVSEESAEPIFTGSQFEVLDDIADEFAAGDSATDFANDYETHYHLAIAYKEMGLMEEAIREFQDAVNLVEVNDADRRFFQCANLLGHCFMEKQMPNLALMWYKRGLEVADLEEEEKQAIYYEMGNAFEIGGDSEKAMDYFGKLYADNVDYRDVSERLAQLQENMTIA